MRNKTHVMRFGTGESGGEDVGGQEVAQGEVGPRADGVQRLGFWRELKCAVLGLTSALSS